MKRTILTGMLALGTGAMCLMAQAPAAPPKGQAAPAKGQANGPKGPAPKSQGELEALQALQAAGGDPDKSIAAAEALITKYADTDFKSVALYIEADAYERKGDFNRMQIYAERVLEADPKDFRAALMLAKHFATHTGTNDLDREEKLAQAEKYANQVIEEMKTLPKPNPAVTDEQWAEARKDSTAEAYSAIGLANLTRKKYDAAAAAFKQAVDANSRPEPAYMVRLASALQSAGKNAEAVEWCDKILAIPDVHPQIKNLATQLKAQATKK